MRTISLIQHALKPYKIVRFTDGFIEQYNQDNDNSNLPTTTKDFYKKILKQHVQTTHLLRKFSDIFEMDANDIGKSFCKNKLKDQLEMKITEFNYKLFHNIIPTGANLLKWKKADTSKCIYCDHDPHNIQHMIFDCPHISNIWTLLNNVLQKDISWTHIIIGCDGETHVNKIISLISFIIYKKYLLDKDKASPNYLKSDCFLLKELNFRLPVYRIINENILASGIIQDIIGVLK